MLNPSLRTGTVFAATVAAAYTACAILFWLFPEAAASFMNALFHGLDFRKLQGAGDFSFGGFLYALVGITAWAFVFGTLFGWLQSRVRPAS